MSTEKVIVFIMEVFSLGLAVTVSPELNNGSVLTQV